MHDPLDTISIGRPITRGPITLFPVYTHADPAPPYLAGPLVADDGMLEIDEVPSAHVPTLVAEVFSDVPILLVDGEALLGGLQDRVLNTTVLLAVGRTEIPVSCVEAGRWADRRRFARAGWRAPRRIRSAVSASVTVSAQHGPDRSSDQGEVWAAVEDALESQGTWSETAALRAAMVERRASSDRVSRALDNLIQLGPLPGQTGVVVAVGSRPVMAEVFDKPATLGLYWTEVLTGLTGEADRPGERPPSLGGALRFVRRLRHAERTELDGVSLGRETRYTMAGQVGSALEWEGAMVHLSTYALAA
jgi:hypothetical protein